MKRIICDRCHKTVDGFRADNFTAGFYDTTGYWSGFANPGEKNVCDACMQSDPRYQAVYGTIPLSTSSAPETDMTAPETK